MMLWDLNEHETWEVNAWAAELLERQEFRELAYWLCDNYDTTNALLCLERMTGAIKACNGVCVSDLPMKALDLTVNCIYRHCIEDDRSALPLLFRTLRGGSIEEKFAAARALSALVDLYAVAVEKHHYDRSRRWLDTKSYAERVHCRNVGRRLRQVLWEQALPLLVYMLSDTNFPISEDIFENSIFDTHFWTPHRNPRLCALEALHMFMYTGFLNSKEYEEVLRGILSILLEENVVYQRAGIHAMRDVLVWSNTESQTESQIAGFSRGLVLNRMVQMGYLRVAETLLRKEIHLLDLAEMCTVMILRGSERDTYAKTYVEVMDFVLEKLMRRLTVATLNMEPKRWKTELKTLKHVTIALLGTWVHGEVRAQTVAASCGGVELLVNEQSSVDQTFGSEWGNRIREILFGTSETIRIREMVSNPNEVWQNREAQASHFVWRSRRDLRALLVVLYMRVKDSQCLRNVGNDASATSIQELIIFVGGSLQRPLRRCILAYI